MDNFKDLWYLTTNSNEVSDLIRSRGEQINGQLLIDFGLKYELLGIRIIHFEGMIKLGMPIVYIVISSIHRKEAFEALEEAIKAYKQRSPVWKKEIYDDGSGTWITTSKTDELPQDESKL